MHIPKILSPKAIIGLGNPGSSFTHTRHNIGFEIMDALSNRHNAIWHAKDKLELAQININNKAVLLIKPQTFMNNSGTIMPFLLKRGISADHILIVHDDLELEFGKITLRIGSSARGHNGLKSFISYIGENFARLRFGIGRPENKEDVPNYVLQKFKETPSEIQVLIGHAIDFIEQLYC